MATENQTDETAPLTLQMFTKYMDEKIVVQIAEVRGRVDNITTQVQSNTAEIRDIQDEISLIRRADTNQKNILLSKEDERRYERLRRSLRIWPVKGKNETDLWTATGDFIHKTLKMPANEMSDEQIEDVRRLRAGGRIHDEVLIIFSDLESRDSVASYARSLADHVDDSGRPRAGLRMDVPPFLMSVFKLLEEHGRKMRARYGPEFKRHIRFDDAARSLYLNVRIPGEQT